MPVIPKTNQRYLTSNGMSVYSLKQNLNQFLTDLSVLEQKNRIGNGYFNTIIPESTLPLYWTCGDITSFAYNPISRTSIVNFATSGSLSQKINFIKPNEQYTAIVFCSSPVSGSFEFGVYGDPGQIFNVNDSLEINKSTSIVTNSDTITKNIIQFTTNSTSVSGSAYVTLTNISASSQQIELQKILVYKGLVELDDVMDSDVPEEYVSRSLIISDSIDVTTYEFFVYDGMLVQNEIEVEEYQKVYTVFINDSATGVNQTYRLRVFNGMLEIEDFTYDALVTKAVNVDDLITGAKYDLTVTNHISEFTVREYELSNFVLVDQAVSGVYQNQRYAMEVKDELLQVLLLDPECSGSSPNGFYIRDSLQPKSYLINMQYGQLTLTEVPFDGTYKLYKETKDYLLNLDYRVFVQNGILEIAQISKELFTPLKTFETFVGDTFGQTCIDAINDVVDIPLLYVKSSNSFVSDYATEAGDANTLDGLDSTYFFPDNKTTTFSKTLLLNTTASGARSTLDSVGNTDFTGTNQTLSSIGMQKLPGGLILQWGISSAIAAEANETLNFYTTFPNACLRTFVSIINDLTTHDDTFARIVSQTTSQITVRAEYPGGLAAGTRYIQYLAIGN